TTGLKNRLENRGLFAPLSDAITDVKAAVAHHYGKNAPIRFTPLEDWALNKQLHGTYVEPQHYTLDHYAQADHMSGAPSVQTRNNVTTTDYNNAQNGTEVRQITIEDGEHAWNGPGSSKYDGPLGHANNELNTSHVVADFFMTHPAVKSGS
ncbi:MAG: hypothetical protein ACRD3W_08640, partial [Terriglobales bacterium]